MRWAKPAHTASECGCSSDAGAAEVDVELLRLAMDGSDGDFSFHEFNHLHCYIRFFHSPASI